MTILLIEDHDATASTLERRLKRTDPSLEIIHARTFADGLRISNELKPDVTLLDLCLPDVKDWRETCRSIEKFYPPVFVITSMELPLVEAECHKYGVRNVFPKVFALELTSVVLSVIASLKMRLIYEKNQALQNA